ncbi:FtsK/SpoIIIE domain-containing protein [Kocuria atrinae]|uniref:FtsK/SpoIIIE domain-containing protein n=1 Tax=Kocuria atrinae TaxID=592377 RepID=UPI0002E845EE|nr:FtsK/SpoIIIE domain-containing protein [Kocuria atrinae]
MRLGEAERTAAVHLGDGPAAVPAEHRLAPVLLNLSQVHHLELIVPSRHRADVINAVAVQLLTGPSAIHQVIVDPEVGWRAPLLPALRVVSFPQHRSVTGPAVEVYSAQTAASITSVEDRVRLVVSVAGDASGGSGASAVLSWDSSIVLSCDVQGAVPGLDPTAGRDRMGLRVDTVSSAVFAPAMQQWSRVQSAIPSLRDVSGLPQSVGTDLVLPQASAIPDLWRATARLPRLEAAIGLSRHGVECLPLSDEHPHLLIAGTTGCGKSEVLRTLVASLACRYSPERLEFLFVDFKGGAALSPLSDLPHRSTLLTDLAPEDVRRALEFLRAELRRRERLLAGLGVSDFQRLLSTAPSAEPLIFRELVVVVDEVKMLVDAFSTAGDELAKIATVGRSLGIHLVLATQRPQGAIPADVRANVSQAVCLRVRAEQDSADVIGSAAAAGISSTTPGRAFVDAGHGAPVEVQTAILTSCAAPPADEVRIRLPGGEHSLRPSGGPEDVSGVETGVLRVVTEIAEAYRHEDGAAQFFSPMGNSPTIAHSTVKPVPVPLPETALQLVCERGDVDLGPAENSSEHWTGRASWTPQTDGTLFLIGQPLHTSRALLSIAEQFASSRSGPALYVITTTPGVEGPTRSWSDAGLLHGTATAQDAWGIKALLECLTRGSQHFLSRSTADHHCPHETAVLMVEDWDRCCTLLRAGPWAHLEDDLISLATSGSQNGVAVVLAGERSLSVGRASSVGRSRVYFPADQTPESLLQWPKLPAVRPFPLRGVLQGAAADRCSPVPAQRSQGAHTVIQVPAPSGDPVRTERAHAGAADPDTSIWPRYRSLPGCWSVTNDRGPGLLVGLSTEHFPVSSDWGPSSTLLVVGPSRSGRSTFLDSVETSLSPGAVLRCHPESADEVERLLSGAGPDTTLIIDDADSLGAQVVQRLGALWQPGSERAASSSEKTCDWSWRCGSATACQRSFHH